MVRIAGQGPGIYWGIEEGEGRECDEIKSEKKRGRGKKEREEENERRKEKRGMREGETETDGYI